MLKRIKNLLFGSVAGGAIIIATFSVLSRLVGLLRDRLLTGTFGAGQVLDAYYAAFRLPDLIFNTLVLGALSSAFTPVFLEIWHKDKEQGWRVANSVLNILFVAIFVLTIIFFALAPLLVNLFVPGFSLEMKLLTTKLTRIMLLSILFFTLSNMVSSVLSSFRRFLAYSLAPILYNLGIIFGVVVLTKILGPIGLAWGVVFGSLLHLLIQLPSVFKTGYHWENTFSVKNPAVKKIGLLMLPRCFGLAISQFNLIVTTIIASGLLAGTVAIYNLAFNLISVPINIFGTSLAISVFPVFSQTLINGEEGSFIHHFSKTVRRILYLIIPTTAIFMLLRIQLVRLILGTGKFDWKDTILTSQALLFFAVSLFAQSLIPVLARAFYAKQDTFTPVKAATVGLVINIVGSLILGPKMGVAGLALAFSISSIINFLILFLILKLHLGQLDEKRVFNSTIKIVFISLIMAAAIQTIKNLVGLSVNMHTFTGVLIQFLSAAFGGGIFYLVLSLLFRCQEIELIKKYLVRVFNR